MKVSLKMFCSIYILVMIVTGLGSFALVETMTTSMLDEKVTAAMESNRHLCESFVMLLEEDGSNLSSVFWWIKHLGTEDGAENVRIEQVDEPKDFPKEPSQEIHLVQDENQNLLWTVSYLSLYESQYQIESTVSLEEYQLYSNNLFGMYRVMVFAIAIICAGILSLVFCYQTRAMKEEVERQEQFMANFAHELKTPMTSMIGYADMLRNYELSEEERKTCADNIYQESRRLERLSMEILDIMVLRKTQIEREWVQISRLMERLTVFAKGMEEKYDIEVELQWEQAECYLNEALFLSLLYNLMENGAKACRVDGRVKVCGKVHRAEYHFVVSDNGIGMSKEVLENATRPFYMEDKSRSRQQGGRTWVD